MYWVVGETPLIQSMRTAVEAAPDDVPLRTHLARLLLESGERDEAVRQAAAVLERDPTSAEAREILLGATAPASEAATVESPQVAAGFDWRRAEAQLDAVVPPMFVDDTDEPAAFDVDRSGITLADVGGMDEVKQRLEAAFLAPMRNPELRKLYGKTLRGGLLLYGPPGCGKTFLARAVAGELGAGFVGISIHDVLDMWIGSSERNLHALFDLARRNAPCVLFIDEVDAIGRRRSQIRGDSRTTVNQLLAELDGADGSNDGLFVLGATNHPWDVDSALRRPGRFDRTLLVLPPDEHARAEIFRYHLRERPIAGIDVGRLAAQTDGYTGADIAHVCDTATERAMLDAARSGDVRMIEMRDLQAAVGEVKPSTGPWLSTARNVALFANQDGTYDELAAYLKRRKLA
jgi:SpoVK/Ycf46/Vps4 family AAA+-type ATPase